ncbi:YwpF-like family protein [Bacillus sp. AG4(2022)]|uniref:YwpF-like family protein n=1 Tax=Bacillus sp. AG4(2022) TaxID=2962594 RepID=UPI0028828ED8|nr:YwpF-like family protein [Bacillus sp. AG4(2022)]MDT0161554.1 YwpF-like family protein [Bacillus sp. AG4(2022)]
MKTFKLISLQVVEEDGLKEIALDDGLIINKEDEYSNWLIEAYTDKSYTRYFSDALDQQKELVVQAVITKKENDPAAFLTKVSSIKELENHISVLLEGSLKRTKSDYAELLLDSLLQSGMEGDVLLSEFKTKMKSKPGLAAVKK